MAGRLDDYAVPSDEQLVSGKTSPADKIDRLSQLRRQMTRSSSLATVRVKRRAMLAEKLKNVFELSEISEVVAGTRVSPMLAVVALF